LQLYTIGSNATTITIVLRCEFYEERRKKFAFSRAKRSIEREGSSRYIREPAQFVVIV